MADLKFTQLPAASSVTTDDLVAITNDPSGTPASQKATVAQILALVNVTNSIVDPSAAIAGSKITPDFGSQNIITTGGIRAGTSPSTTGKLNVPNGTANGLYGRNLANDADRCIAGVDSSNRSFLGDGVSNFFRVSAGGGDGGLGVSGEFVYDVGATQLHRFRVGGTEFFRIAGTTAIHLFAVGASVGGGVGVAFVGNATTAPTTNPSAGGLLYSEAGAGKWRGSGGTVTTFGPAEPHCPRCGTDVGVSQSENDLFGEELVHCHACELSTGNGVVRHVANFFDRRAA